MGKRHYFFETFCFAIISIVIILCALFFMHFDCYSNDYIDTRLTDRSRVLSQVLIIYGSLIFLIAIASYCKIKMQGSTVIARLNIFLKTLLIEIKTTIKWVKEKAQIKNDGIYIFIILIIGVMVRSYFLAQPMRYDESYTFLSFVNGSIFDLFYYPQPNNHILHTLFVRLTVEVFGAHPVAIRLTAFIAGVCVIPLTFLLNRLITRDSASGYFSSASVTVFPYLILFDTMARGYSLIVFFSILLSILGFRFLEKSSIELSFFISLTVALGLYCIPIFLFPAVGVLLWISISFMKQGEKFIHLFHYLILPCSIMILGFTSILYTPTIIVSRGIDTLIANSFVESLSWSVFINDLNIYFIKIISSFTREIHVSIVITLLLLFILGYYSLLKQKLIINAIFFPSLLVGALLVLFLRQVLPPVRVWIYFLPLFFMIADIGLLTIVKSGQKLKKISIIFAIFVSFILMNNNVISKYPDTGTFTEASTIVEILSYLMRANDSLIVKTPADGPIYFYMWYQNVPNSNKNILDNNNTEQQTFYVIKKSRYSILDLTDAGTEKIVDIGDAELHVSMGN